MLNRAFLLEALTIESKRGTEIGKRLTCASCCTNGEVATSKLKHLGETEAVCL